MRAANGSPLTVNTFVFAILLLEGMQLHLGLRVVNIFPTFFWDIPSYKNAIPLLIGLREACAYANGTVFMLRKLWTPPTSSGAFNPPLGVCPCLPCTESPSAQTRARSLLSLSVTQVPITWQVGDFLSESEALDVSLLNFISKTDDAKWLCLW